MEKTIKFLTDKVKLNKALISKLEQPNTPLCQRKDIQALEAFNKEVEDSIAVLTNIKDFIDTVNISDQFQEISDESQSKLFIAVTAMGDYSILFADETNPYPSESVNRMMSAGLAYTSAAKELYLLKMFRKKNNINIDKNKHDNE